MSAAQSAEDAIQDAAEKQITDMVRRLIAAARDGRAHLSHEDGANCMGCRSVRQAIEFVKAMSNETVFNNASNSGEITEADRRVLGDEAEATP